MNEDQNEWPRISKPSAIDHLLSGKLVGEMTADEYLVLARQARIALHEGKAAKLRRPRSVA